MAPLEGPGSTCFLGGLANRSRPPHYDSSTDPFITSLPSRPLGRIYEKDPLRQTFTRPVKRDASEGLPPTPKEEFQGGGVCSHLLIRTSGINTSFGLIKHWVTSVGPLFAAPFSWSRYSISDVGVGCSLVAKTWWLGWSSLYPWSLVKGLREEEPDTDWEIAGAKLPEKWSEC